jgi:uncharacterized membrane protein
LRATEHNPLADDADSPVAGTSESLPGHIHENIGNIAEFHQREEQKAGHSQRQLEVLSKMIGRPFYLLFLMSFVLLWTGVNTLLMLLGSRPFDPPPFTWLQGLISLAALVTTTIVLAAQNRQAKLETQRAHLDLQVNLSTEQKVSKIIDLLEELRRDLPMVKDRHDPEAVRLQQRADTAQVLSALADVGVVPDEPAAQEAEPKR